MPVTYSIYNYNMDNTQSSSDEDNNSSTSGELEEVYVGYWSLPSYFRHKKIHRSSVHGKISDSSESSRVSLKSDWSMNPPPLLSAKERKSLNSNKSSQVSVRSDWSMNPPPLLRAKGKSAESSRVPANIDWDVCSPFLRVERKSSALRLSKCGLTEECCTALASALSSKLSQVRELDLSGNKLGDSGMKTLSSGLENLHCKLEILRLRSCGITATGCTTLASALWSNPEHIRELDLSENNIRDWGFKHLFTELKNTDCKLEKLGLSNCGISIEGCAALTSALIINPSHLRELDISRNSLGDTGQELLTSLLNSQHHKLEKLLLHKFPMTYTSLPSSHSPEMFPQRVRPHTLNE